MRKDNRFLLIIAIIMGTILLFLTIYIIYLLNSKEDNYSASNNVDNVQTLNDISQKLVEKMLKFRDVNDAYIFFSENDLYYEDISASSRLMLAYQNIDSNFITRYNVSQSCDYSISFLDACKTSSVLKKDFEDSFYDLFGNNKIIKYEEFYNNGNICRLNNDVIECSAITKNSDKKGTFYLKYDYAEYENDLLSIYVNQIYVDGAISNNGLYYFSDLVTKIDDDKYIKTLESYPNLNNADLAKLFDYYKGRTTIYRIMFDTKDNNFYWIATELVK